VSPEFCKALLPVFTAFSEGRKCETLNSIGEWVPVFNPNWAFGPTAYRIATEPTFRPWTVEEVPLLALCRPKTSKDCRWIITAALKTAKGDEVRGSLGIEGADLYLKHYEHSTDGGKTWLPCGVLEGSK